MKNSLDKIYTELFNEEARLCRNNASKVEFLTNKKYILENLKQGDRILELGAGTGRYTTMLAKEGYDITAVEYVGNNLEVLKSKITEDMNITALQGDALDLSRFEDESFDVVLNMGPLYHFPKHQDRVKVVMESMRVLKKDGTACFAFIVNDMVFVTESLFYNPDFLDNKDNAYDDKTFKVSDYPFTFLTIDSVKHLMAETGCKQHKFIASDGYAELLEERINQLGDEQFKRWFDFHLYTCEKPECLGASHHVLYITRK